MDADWASKVSGKPKHDSEGSADHFRGALEHDATVGGDPVRQ